MSDHGEKVWKAKRDQVMNGNIPAGEWNEKGQTVDEISGNPREECEEILIIKSSHTTGRLHIPVDDSGKAKLCNRTVNDLKRKNIAKYPPGHKEWCKYCLDIWTDE